MRFRLVRKSVTFNDLERHNGIILHYFSEFGQLPGALRKSSRSLSHLLMSSCLVFANAVHCYGRPMEQGRPLYFCPVVSSSSSLFFSSPNLSRRRLDVCHTSTHGVALVRIQDAGLKRAARGSLKIQDTKKSPKIAIWAPSHNFVGLYLRN